MNRRRLRDAVISDLDVSNEELLRAAALLPLVLIVVVGFWLGCLALVALAS